MSNEMSRLQKGEAVVIGGRLMAICQNCGKLVRVDKPIFGGWHICATAEEIAARKRL